MASCPGCYCGGGCSEKKEEAATPTELMQKVAALFDKVEKVRSSSPLATIHTHTRPLVCLHQPPSHGPTSPSRPASRSNMPCGLDQPTEDLCYLANDLAYACLTAPHLPCRLRR